MRKKYAVACMLAAMMLVGVSNTRAASKNVDVKLVMGDMVRVFDAEPSSGVLELPGLYQTEGTVPDPGKGEALKDACRFRGSTLVINAKVKIKLSGYNQNFIVNVKLTDTSGKIYYNPSELNFTIPSGQAENTVNLVMTVKDVEMGVYGITVTARINDADTGALILDPHSGNSDFKDTENITINVATLTPPPKIMLCKDNVTGNVISYSLSRGYIAGTPNYYPCDITAAKLKVYDSGNNLYSSMDVPATDGPHVVIWDGRQGDKNDGTGTCTFSDLFYLELELNKRVYVNGNVVVDTVVETSASQVVAGVPGGSQTIVVIRIPDDLSGVDLSTIDPAKIDIDVTLSGVTTHILNFKKAQFGTDALVTLMSGPGASDYYYFQGPNHYTVTLTAAATGALDKAGNEWDVDGIPNNNNGVPKKVVIWNFDVNGSGAIVPSDPFVTIP